MKGFVFVENHALKEMLENKVRRFERKERMNKHTKNERRKIFQNLEEGWRELEKRGKEEKE
jgi:hypothetical protein